MFHVLHRSSPAVIACALAVLPLGCSDTSDDKGAGSAAQDGSSPVLEKVPFDPAGCSSPTSAPGDSLTIELEHGGQTRQYIIHVPPGVDPKAPTPLVLNWHGLTSSAEQQQFLAGNAIADERKVIVAYPNGLGDPGGQSFNGGICCNKLGSPPHEADDVDFGRTIVADIASRLCVDRRRIYSTGMSNGGYMSEYNACQAADLYAAVAPVSAMAPRPACEPSRPVPLIAFNGTEDPLVGYSAAQSAVTGWVERNGCTGEPTRKDYGTSFCNTWSNCSEGVVVTSCTVTGMNHCWPGNTLVIPGFCASGGLAELDANQLMYDFFEQFAL